MYQYYTMEMLGPDMHRNLMLDTNELECDWYTKWMYEQRESGERKAQPLRNALRRLNVRTAR